MECVYYVCVARCMFSTGSLRNGNDIGQCFAQGRIAVVCKVNIKTDVYYSTRMHSLMVVTISTVGAISHLR